MSPRPTDGQDSALPAAWAAQAVALCPDATLVFDGQGRLQLRNGALADLLPAPALEDGYSFEDFAGALQGLQRSGSPRLPPQQVLCRQPERAPRRLPLAQGRTLGLRAAGGAQGSLVLWLSDVTHEVEVDRMKSEFLATAAHELRNPMASIHGFAELLQARVLSPDRLREVATILHRQTSALVHLVNELLDLARIEARRDSDLRLETFTLERLLADTRAGLAGARGGAGGELRRLTMEIDPAARLRADPAKASRALGNVLSNALKYSPDPRPVTVRSQLHLDDQGVWLDVAVQDHGVGMSPTELGRAFERFFRANPHGAIPGTGLGLSLVKEIMAAMGGSVVLESRLGEGTTVTLRFPAEAGPGDGPDDPQPSRSRARKAVRKAANNGV